MKIFFLTEYLLTINYLRLRFIDKPLLLSAKSKTLSVNLITSIYKSSEMIENKNHTSGTTQGASPAKTKRPPLKFITFNEDGKATLLNGTQIVNLLGMYFVKMPLQDAFFKILDDGGIDFKNPISESMMVVALQDLGVKNMAVAKKLS